MNDVFNLDLLDLAEIVFRTSVVYLALLLGLRVAGKRELGQLSVFDLLVILIISNAVQNAMLGPDTSLTGGLVAAGSLLLVNHIVGILRQKISWLGDSLEGSPTLLVYEGAFIMEHLNQEGVTANEVMQALREHGVAEVSQVKLAVLEVDGTISVVPEDLKVTRTRRRLRGRKPIV